MDPSTIPSVSFATKDFDTWRESISVVFDVEPPPEGARTPFSADVAAYQLGDMVVTNAVLADQRYIRSPVKARRDGMDHYALNLYRSGGWKSQTDDGEFDGKPGQVSVLDLARYLISDEPTSNIVTLFIPRSLIETKLPNLSALHGSAPVGPYAQLLSEFIDLLARRLPSLPATNDQALSRATLEMLSACVQPSIAGLEAARPGLEIVLSSRAKRFICSRLDRPDLTVDAVCHAVGVSRRTLYRLFQAEGGVQHYIQVKRLEFVRSLLSDPNETRRISEIAAEFGFLRSDHFARAFKNQFGRSPSELRDPTFRAVGTQANGTTKAPEMQRFDSWIKALHS